MDRRRTARTVLFSALAVAAAGLLLVATPARSATTRIATAAAIAPPGHHPATEPTLLTLLAGDSKYAVYGLGDQLAGGAHVGDQPPAIGSEHLFARTKSGRTIHLGRAPRGLEPEMSLSGSMLTGFTQQPICCTPGRFLGAYWWNLSNGTSGRFTFPKRFRYRSAAPHGAVISKARELFLVSMNGKRHSLGTPFPHQAGLQITAGDHGFVVLPFASQHMTSPQSMAYMSFAHRGHFTKLQTRGTHAIACSSVNKIAAGCVALGAEDDAARVELIPVSGRAPTTTSSGAPGAGAVAGRTVIWSTASGLQSIRLGHPEVRTGPARFAEGGRFGLAISASDPFADMHDQEAGIVTAYGGAVMTYGTATKLEIAKTVTDARVIFTRPPSAASVSAFALTPNRISYIDDQKRRHGHGQFSTYTSNISSPSHHAVLGKPVLVRGNTDYKLVGISKQVKVYSTNPSGAEEHSVLTVRYHGTNHSIRHVPFDSYLRVSGTRVMFADDRNTQEPGTSAVYDAATGTTTTVSTNSTCCDPSGTEDIIGRTPALAGHMVTYFSPSGAVMQHDLISGHERTLSGPVSDFRSGIVFAAGKYVAWRIQRNPPAGRINAYRNVATMSHAVSVHGQVFGVSNAGVLVAPHGVTTNVPGKEGFTAAFDLLRFSGKRTTVIKKQNEYVLPQIAGSTVAWVNIDGLLRDRSVG